MHIWLLHIYIFIYIYIYLYIHIYIYTYIYRERERQREGEREISEMPGFQKECATAGCNMKSSGIPSESRSCMLRSQALQAHRGAGRDVDLGRIQRRRSVGRMSADPRNTFEACSPTQRVQVPNIWGLWSQKPLMVWFLEPESSNIGYFDPLGHVRGHFSVGHLLGFCTDTTELAITRSGEESFPSGLAVTEEPASLIQRACRAARESLCCKARARKGEALCRKKDTCDTSVGLLSRPRSLAQLNNSRVPRLKNRRTCKHPAARAAVSKSPAAPGQLSKIVALLHLSFP